MSRSAARDRARNLAYVLDRALAGAHTRTRAPAHARTPARGRARVLDRFRGGALDRDLDRARALARTLARAHDLDRARARDLARALDRALASGVRFLDPDRLDRARDLNLARDLAHDLARALDCEPFRVLERHYVTPGGARSMPGRVSRGLMALAVRMLPAPQRPRYRVEFRVELVELPRREQWRYALRILASAWELRRALNEAVHTPDGQPVRRAER